MHGASGRIGTLCSGLPSESARCCRCRARGLRRRSTRPPDLNETPDPTVVIRPLKRCDLRPPERFMAMAITSTTAETTNHLRNPQSSACTRTCRRQAINIRKVKQVTETDPVKARRNETWQRSELNTLAMPGVLGRWIDHAKMRTMLRGPSDALGTK